MVKCYLVFRFCEKTRELYTVQALPDRLGKGAKRSLQDACGEQIVALKDAFDFPQATAQQLVGIKIRQLLKQQVVQRGRFAHVCSAIDGNYGRKLHRLWCPKVTAEIKGTSQYFHFLRTGVCIHCRHLNQLPAAHIEYIQTIRDVRG